MASSCQNTRLAIHEHFQSQENREPLRNPSSPIGFREVIDRVTDLSEKNIPQHYIVRRSDNVTRLLEQPCTQAADGDEHDSPSSGKGKDATSCCSQLHHSLEAF